MSAVPVELTPGELLLVGESGFHPVGHVIGTSVFHARQQLWAPTLLAELESLSVTLSAAREAAVARMRAEAKQLGASGVVGVHLSLEERDLGSDVHELLATGTAIAGGTPAGEPFTSNLTGEDFWMLLQAGCSPVALVMGACVFHLGHRTYGPQTAELVDYTTALSDARARAQGRMHAEAAALPASGVVGVRLSEQRRTFGSRTAEFLAVGTAVRRSHEAALPRPVPTVPL